MALNELDLLKSSGLLELVLEALPVGVWIVDKQGHIIYGNPEGKKIWAGSRYVGIEQYGEYKGWWRSTGQRIAPEEWAAARAIRRGEVSLNEEIEIECFDGTHKIILNSGMPVRNPQGEVIGCVIVNMDITDRIRLQERLQSMADTDDLTRVHSRRRIYELLHEEVKRSNRYRRPLAVILFDVDRFKQVNDTYGHIAGDEVLVFLSRVVRAQIRESEHLGRIGGDEFLLLLPETRLADAANLVERLQASLARQPFGASGVISCSFGVCEHDPGEAVDQLIRRVDQALYRAKAAGRGQSVADAVAPGRT